MRSAPFLVLLLALWGSAQAACLTDTPALADFAAKPGNTVKGPYTPEELEKRNMIAIRGTDKVLPFGYSNEKWKELKESMLPKDELYFTVRRDGRFYMDAYVLVRDGCMINMLVGAIS